MKKFITITIAVASISGFVHAEVVGHTAFVSDIYSAEYTVPAGKTFVVSQIWVNSGGEPLSYNLRVTPGGAPTWWTLSYTNETAVVFDPPLYFQAGTMFWGSTSSSDDSERYLIVGLLADSSDLFVNFNPSKFQNNIQMAGSTMSGTELAFGISVPQPTKYDINVDESEDMSNWTECMDALIEKTSDGKVYDVTVPIPVDKDKMFYRTGLKTRRGIDME